MSREQRVSGCSTNGGESAANAVPIGIYDLSPQTCIKYNLSRTFFALLPYFEQPRALSPIWTETLGKRSRLGQENGRSIPASKRNQRFHRPESVKGGKSHPFKAHFAHLAFDMRAIFWHSSSSGSGKH